MNNNPANTPGGVPEPTVPAPGQPGTEPPTHPPPSPDPTIEAPEFQYLTEGTDPDKVSKK
jgi:hypothetical protein